METEENQVLLSSSSTLNDLVQVTMASENSSDSTMKISQAISSNRPSIPPKPKSSELSIERSTSNVATQVNLLARRKVAESTKDCKVESDPNGNEVSDLTTPRGVGTSKLPIRSTSCPSQRVKPVLPPKPSKARISQRKSVPSTTPTTPPILSDPPCQDSSNICVESNSTSQLIDDLNNICVPTSACHSVPWSPLPTTEENLHEHQTTELQSDNQLPKPKLTSFEPSVLSPIQRVQAKLKSTSLGRNTTLTSFTRNSTLFSRLDLHSHTPITSPSQINFNETFKRLSAPPIPPTRRNSHKSQSIQALALDTPPTPLTFSTLPSSVAISTLPEVSILPIYAVVNRERKWEVRRLKEEKVEFVNNLLPSDDVTKLDSEEMPLDVTNRGESSVTVIANPVEEEDSPSSPEHIPTFPPSNTSWLEKYISQSCEKEGSSADPYQSINNSSPDPNPDDDLIKGNSSFLFSRQRIATTNELVPISDENSIAKIDVCSTDVFESDTTTSPEQEKIVDCSTKLSTENVSESFNQESTPTTNDLCTEKTLDTSALRNEVIGLIQKFNTAASLEEKESESLTLENINDSKSISDADLISEIIRSQNQFKSSLVKSERSQDGSPKKTKDEKILTGKPVLPPLMRPDGSLRRRSWTCSEVTSCSLTESSPTSSSSSSLRERACSISESMNSQTTWADEGDLSTGVLGDAENSDPCQGGSFEDFSPTTASTPSSSFSHPFSRRRRLVRTFFASFGKTAASNTSTLTRHTNVPMRVPPSGRRKEKSRSHFFLESAQSSKIKHTNSGTSLPVFHPHPASRSATQNSTSPVVPSSTLQLDEGDSGIFKKAFGGSIDQSKAERHDSPHNINISTECYDDILAGLTNPKERQAFYVAREILTSERAFMTKLNLLTVEFPQFLEGKRRELNQPIISRDDMEYILGGLPNLKLVNEALLQDLEIRISNWISNPKVSDIIIKIGPFLKHYSTYIRDYPKILSRFEHLRLKNSMFARVVEEFETLDICQNLFLKHNFLKPIQRMPQYQLLLGDYLKNLHPNHPDYEDTQKAISIVKGVAEHGNQTIRLQENAEKLIQLQYRLTNVILKADRQLIHEGELLKVCRKELQPRYFALMSDCLLCMNYAGTGTSTGNREFKLRYELPLTGMRVTLPPSEDSQNEFSVISVQRSFTLVAKNPRERNEWMTAIKKAIENNIRKRAGTIREPDIIELTEIGKVAPVWIADSRVTMCQCCTAEFTITFRRHHCRACGRVVCSHCSGNEAPLPYLNNEAARVCDECYPHLVEEFDRENMENDTDEIGAIRNRYKKGTPNMSKRGTKHKTPHRLEVHGSVAGFAMRGYLNWKEHRKGWKRHWFVLMDRVLYVYAASEDVVATRSIPILGYEVEKVSNEADEEDEGYMMFQLKHSGQEPFIFQTDNAASGERWIQAMQEATILEEVPTKDERAV